MAKNPITINLHRSVFEMLKKRIDYLPPVASAYITLLDSEEYGLLKYVNSNLSSSVFKHLSKVLIYESIFEFVYPELTEIMVTTIRLIDAESLHKNPTTSEIQVALVNTVLAKPYLPKNRILMRDEAMKRFFDYLIDRTKEIIDEAVKLLVYTKYNQISSKYGDLSEDALIDLFKDIVDLAFSIYKTDDNLKEEIYKTTVLKRKIVQSIKIGGFNYENFDNRGYPLSQLEI